MAQPKGSLKKLKVLPPRVYGRITIGWFVGNVTTICSIHVQIRVSRITESCAADWRIFRHFASYHCENFLDTRRILR